MIPVSVITGYLGSGKTTILKKVLADPEYGDTAVIINEFGEVGLDHELIETSDEDLVTLKTGCLCCKMRGDLVETLDDLWTRRQTGAITPFKRVMIETSGLADPIPILQGLMVDETAACNFQLDRVVTVVDSVNGAQTISREPEAARQIAIADRLLLTKMDLLSEQHGALVASVRSLNPNANCMTASHGNVQPTVMFSDEGKEPAAKLLNLEDLPTIAATASGHTSGAISTFTLIRSRPVAAVALTLFLEALADHCGENLLRLKGLVQISETPEQPAVIHGVQHVFHPPTWLDRWPSDDHRTRIVFIGRHLSEAWVEALLQAIEIEVSEFGVEQR